MPRLKHFVSLACCSVALFTLTACQHRATFYLISNNLKLPYWKTVDTGFHKAAAEYHVTALLRGPDNYDPAAELDEFKKAVAAKPAGILVSVADAVTFRSAITDAVQGGTPVITVDSDAPTSARLFFIGTNNVAAGRLGGERLASRLNGKGNILVFSIPGQPNLDERLRGYKDILADHPQMKIVEVLNVKGDPGIAYDSARKYLDRKGPDKIDAFVSLESSSGPAIGEVLKRANITDRTVIAMDVGPETLDLIKNGVIDASVSQKPFTMGYVGLAMLDAIQHHRPDNFQSNYTVDSFARYASFIDTGTSLVTRDNVDFYLQSQQKANQ
jgi:ribose transport system substrate-binding protein